MQMRLSWLALVGMLFVPGLASAQITYTWGNNAGTAWATVANWSGTPAGIPGSNSDTANNDIALWTSVSTGSTIQLNFNNLGTPYYVGTLQTAAGAVAKTLGSNTNTAGILQLNGTGLNNLILDHLGSNAFTIAPQAGGGNGPLTLRLNAANSTINNVGAVTISAQITGTGTNAITKTGAGTLTLSNANNTFSGGITHNGGTAASAITITQPGALGTGAFTWETYSRLNLSVPDGTTWTIPNHFILPALGGSSALLRTGDGSPTANTILRLTGELSGGTTGQNYRFVDSDQSGNHNHVVILENPNNTMAGTLEMWRGTLAILSDDVLGNINVIQHFTENVNGQFRFDADNIVVNANRNFVMPGSNNIRPFNTQGFTATIAGVISGTGQLTKQGTGTLILTGANTYTNPTVISAGTLQIGSGGSTGTLGIGNVNINAGTTLAFNRSDIATVNNVITGTGTMNQIGTGTTILSGNNSFTGPTNIISGTLGLGGTGVLNSSFITVNSGAVFDVSALQEYTLDQGRTIQVGRSGSPATDLLGNLDLFEANFRVGPLNVFRTATISGNLFSINSNFFFDLGSVVTPGDGVNDLVVVTGDLTFLGTNSFSITQPASGLVNGDYTLFNYTGNLFLDVQPFVVANSSTRQIFTFDTATPGSVLLNVLGAPANLTWSGSTNSNWDLVTTAGNFAGAADTRFYNLDTVTFDDTAATGQVNLFSTLAPTNVIVNNSIINYTFGGSGTLDGIMSLTKNGTGLLTITTDNTYTGGTTINAGTLQLGDGGTSGSVTGGILNNSTLAINRSGTVNFSNLVSGTGNLSVLGGGTVSLTALNTYAGSTTITGGSVLSITTDANLGTPPATATPNFLNLDNGTLAIGTNAVTINANRGINLGLGNGTIATGTATTYNGIITGPGSLTKTGTATLTLTGTNTFTGGTTVNAGTVAFTNSSAFGSGTITFGTSVTSQAGFSTDPGTSVFFNNSISADTTVANNIVLPAPTVNTTYTIRKDSAGGQLNFTGDISGGSANAKFFLNASTGGDNTTTYRFAGNNSFQAAIIEVWRGGVVIASPNAFGLSTNLLRINSNNNTVLGDLRFDFNGTFANPVELVAGGGGAINTNANTVTMSGVISGSFTAGIRKLGSGTLILTNANTVTTNSSVVEGTLLVNNTSGSGIGTGNLTVFSGATFGGTGSISGSLILNNGIIAPGVSPGTLTIGGSVSGNGSLNFEVATVGTASTSNGGSDAGSSKDLLTIGGTIDVSGLVINPISLGSTGFNNLQFYSWTVLTSAGGVTGTPTLGTASGTDFTNLGGGTFSLATDANSVYLNFTPVPEPGTILAVSGFGLAVLLRVRKQKFKLSPEEKALAC